MKVENGSLSKMSKFQVQLLQTLVFILLGFGLFLRFWNITDNQFLFYDEGMYLGYNRKFLNLVAANLPKDINDLFAILGLMFKAALGTAKSLWFFLLNLRVFGFGPEAWSFARVISAIAAVFTILLTYSFAKRYFKSQIIAVLSLVFLSLLPSHVFYSRLGMQESLSTFLFLSGIYIYVFYSSEKWSPFVSALLLSCVFFTNYRMIISPIYIFAIECFESIKNKESINWKRLLMTIGTFSVIVFVIGSLYEGINRYVTFGWMSHQAEEAKEQGGFLNFLSYPFYTFVLEGVFFGLIFWANFYLLFKKQFSKLLPFLLVLLQMGIFSLAAEKGVRYLCVLLPFMAIAAAVSADYFLNIAYLRKYFIGIILLACMLMVFLSSQIASSTTDYDKAVQTIFSHDPTARILSTQPLVEQLYVPNEELIKESPKNLADFLALYNSGYRYLILDPQVYISWTKNEKRFSPPLIDFLEFINESVTPKVSFNHLNKVMLERFVLDHNQNLATSISFLSEAQKMEYGKIKIYDIGDCLRLLQQQSLQKNINLKTNS